MAVSSIRDDRNRGLIRPLLTASQSVDKPCRGACTCPFVLRIFVGRKVEVIGMDEASVAPEPWGEGVPLPHPVFARSPLTSRYCINLIVSSPRPTPKRRSLRLHRGEAPRRCARRAGHAERGAACSISARSTPAAKRPSSTSSARWTASRRGHPSRGARARRRDGPVSSSPRRASFHEALGRDAGDRLGRCAGSRGGSARAILSVRMRFPTRGWPSGPTTGFSS